MYIIVHDPRESLPPCTATSVTVYIEAVWLRVEGKQVKDIEKGCRLYSPCACALKPRKNDGNHSPLLVALGISALQHMSERECLS
jgi:hypothetical protein